MKQISSDAKPFLSMEGITLRLYDRTLFNGIYWRIRSDQHWAVTGPNGSGKSTLVRAILGKVPVVQGQVLYHFWEEMATEDHPVGGDRPQDHIVYVSLDAQKTFLRGENPFYQGRWNIGVSGETLSVSQYLSEDRVGRINPYQLLEERPDPVAYAAQRAKVVELLDIEELLERDIVQLSDGERRKVGLARALMRAPRLLILDNPFTGLDVSFRTKLSSVIERLMQEDMRVIVVTARGDEVPPGITNVLQVENGAVVAQGPAEVILNGRTVRRIARLDRPRSPAAPNLLNTSPQTQAETSGTAILGEASWASRTAKSDYPEEERSREEKVARPVLVQMRDVNVSYDGTEILRGIDWTVCQGENWALLGPNGSGKTTLLSLILADNPQAYANDILLFGKRRGSGESIWEIKQRIGWVAPELHLYYPRRVSCFGIVCSGFFDSVGLYRQCSPAQREMARSWMQRLGMSRVADAAFAALSEGEQRMVLVARALVKRPMLLILDEPCQGLDAGNRDRVLQIVDAVADHTDTNIIYVTHRADELPKVITHVIRLDRGRIVQKARVYHPNDPGKTGSRGILFAVPTEGNRKDPL